MIEKIADDLIGQMTEARLIDKEMEARYVYVFICYFSCKLCIDQSSRNCLCRWPRIPTSIRYKRALGN